MKENQIFWMCSDPAQRLRNQAATMFLVSTYQIDKNDIPLFPHEKPTGWVNTKDRLPDSGMLIVKRWKNGSVWAGVYAGGSKDSSFDEWIELPQERA